MTKINFQYLNKPLILDLDKGVLLGDEEVRLEVVGIVDNVANDEYHGGSIGGEAGLPFDTVQLEDPYHDAEQFAMCLFYGLIHGDTFPSELNKYLKYHQPTKRDDILILH